MPGYVDRPLLFLQRRDDEIEDCVSDRPVGLKEAGMHARATLQRDEAGVEIGPPIQAVFRAAENDNQYFFPFSYEACGAHVAIDETLTTVKSVPTNRIVEFCPRRIIAVEQFIAAVSKLRH